MTTVKKSILRNGLILTIILATALSFSSPCLAALPENSEISPQWANMSAVALNITFSDYIGLAEAEIYKKSSTTSIDATLTVYQRVGSYWVYVKRASASSTSNLMIDFEFIAEEGATYKAVLDITAYGTYENDTETLTKTKTYTVQPN